MTTLEFSAMVQQYQSLVYTVCHQLVPDVGDAQDLTQDKMGNEELETFLPMLSFVVYHRLCSVPIVTFAQYNF